jgi:alkanesulfonate monooxygenase SsuD/methylene tetrahydromethanopterin reductase-like flavin-dependent oxidoreductase (luciferase family)
LLWSGYAPQELAMKVGYFILAQSRPGVSDTQLYQEEMSLALEAEDLGFDWIMAVEHHFTDYAMVPDNAQVMSYLAGKTKTIGLFPSAFILPWQDPLRVAEKSILLDHLSGGRAVIGFGRGLARCEFNAFRANMAESRERFDEAAAMILEALETGFIEGSGKYYQQPRVELRPRPFKSFKGRTFMVGSSPASVEMAAKLGLACMKFSQAPWEGAKAELDAYRAAFKRFHGTDAPPILTADLIVCGKDKQQAAADAFKYQSEYWYIVMRHYELLNKEIFDKTGTSYGSYSAISAYLRQDQGKQAAENYVAANLCGDPDTILKQLERRRAAIGDFNIALTVRYGSMPIELARSSYRLFAKEVLPVIKAWQAPGNLPKAVASA